MKTKIYLLLIVLFSISLKAQIPTLAERNFSIYKNLSATSNFDNTKKIIEEEIKSLEKENENLEKKINEDNEFLNNQQDPKILQVEIFQEIANNSKLLQENINKVNELKVLKESLAITPDKISSKYSDIYIRLYGKKINSINEMIKTKEANIANLDNIQEVDEEILAIKSLRKQIEELQYEFKTKNEHYKWFPSIKAKYSNAFYKAIYNIKDNETSYLNSFALNYNDLGAVVQSEIIADTFGSLRVSFGSILQSNSETPETEEEKEEQSEQDQLDQLINGGGNFYLEAIYPVYFNKGSICTLYGFLNNKYAFTLDGLNQYIDSDAFNGSLGANLYFGLNSDENKFNFFIQSDANVVVGSNTLYQNLQLADEKPFLQGKLIVGVTFLSKFRLAATINSFGSDEALRRNKVAFGLQIIP